MKTRMAKVAAYGLIIAAATTAGYAGVEAVATVGPSGDRRDDGGPGQDRAAAGSAELAPGFAALYGPYELIRLALLADRSVEVSDQAGRIVEAARALSESFSADSAGVAKEAEEEVQALLSEILRHAKSLGEATDVEAAREAFGELSDRMVDYRNSLIGDQPSVAYCPMIDRAWLQSDEEIGNPFYGSAMPRCGEITAN